MGLFDLLTTTVAIEAGSASTRIHKKGQLIYDEPTVISIDPQQNKVTGIGSKVDSSTPNILLEPFNYVISDFQGFESYLRGALKRADKGSGWFPKSYDMYFSIPIGTTEVEKRAFRDSAEHAGARSVYMIHSPVSSAHGMELLFEQRDFILVDFSKSKFEVSIFLDSVPRHDKTLRLGSQKLESIVLNHLRRKYDITPSKDEFRNLINRNLSQASNQTIQYKEISQPEIGTLINQYLSFVIDELTNCLEACDNSDLSKLTGKGIYFTGGGTLYNNICEEITNRLGLTSNLSSNPLVDGINGISKIMENPKKFGQYLMA